VRWSEFSSRIGIGYDAVERSVNLRAAAIRLERGELAHKEICSAMRRHPNRGPSPHLTDSGHDIGRRAFGAWHSAALAREPQLDAKDGQATHDSEGVLIEPGLASPGL
jgi:hypothetical protein